MLQSKNFLGSFFVAGWALGLLFVSATLMVGHWVSLPNPDIGSKLRNADALLESVEAGNDVFAIHFLYDNCPCSRRIMDHLQDRGSHPTIPETIVLIRDKDQPSRSTLATDFKWLMTTPAELKSRFGIDSAPLMVVLNSSGQILYSGGYTSRKQGLDYADTQILSDILANQPVESLPVFGCAVSNELKQLVDPLGLKAIESSN